jgi:HEPN domain-containing protein
MNVECQQWLDHSRIDLKHAKAILTHNEQEDTYIIYFHAQQAAEKALKAVLVFHFQIVPRTHDLAVLCREVSSYFSVTSDVVDIAFLTLGAVNTRYPVDNLTFDQAEEAVKIADSIYQQVLNYLAPLLENVHESGSHS